MPCFSPFFLSFELNRSRDLFYSRAALCSTAILAPAFFFYSFSNVRLWNTRRRLSLHYIHRIFSCLITSIFRYANPAELSHFPTYQFTPPTTSSHSPATPSNQPSSLRTAPAYPEKHTLQCPLNLHRNPPTETKHESRTLQYVFTLSSRYNCAVL